MRIKTSEFRAVLSNVSRVANGRIKEILGCFLIKPAPEKTFVHASNGEDMLLSAIDAEDPFTVLLPVDKVSAILADANSQEIIIDKIEETSVRFIAGRSRFDLNTQDPSEFPPAPSSDPDGVVVFSKSSLLEAFRSTVFAVDGSDGRYSLSGVAIDLDALEGLASVVGTDGRRMSVSKIPFAGNGSGVHLIPQRSVQNLIRFLDSKDEYDVSVGLAGNNVSFSGGGFTYFSSLVAGRYPQWQKIIPDYAIWSSVIAPKDDLVRGIRQAKVLLPKENSGCLLQFSRNCINISTSDAMGLSSIEVDAESDAGVPSVRAACDYLLDALRVFTSSEIGIRIKDAKHPIIMLDGDNSFHLVMPIDRQ